MIKIKQKRILRVIFVLAVLLLSAGCLTAENSINASKADNLQTLPNAGIQNKIKQNTIPSSLATENNAQQNIPTDKTNLRKLTLNIEGMYCTGCAAGIKGMLESTAGVISAEIEQPPAGKKGIVIYDSSKIGREEIVNNEIFSEYSSYSAEIIEDKPLEE